MFKSIEQFGLPPNRLRSASPITSQFNIDYRLESARLESFKNWPCTWMEPEKLAAAGFYYTGDKDMVRCFECHVEILEWQPDDSPMADHQQYSAGKCRFARNIPCGNVPIGADPSTIPVPYRIINPEAPEFYDIIRMFCGPDNEEFITENAMKLNIGGFTATRPKYPKYVSYDARLCTYEKWPKASMSQTKEALATAGLFYADYPDKTICYSCGRFFEDWEPEDDPWEKHAKQFDDCSYLYLMKGRDYVSKFVGRTDAKSDIVKPSTNIKQDQTSGKDECTARGSSPPNRLRSASPITSHLCDDDDGLWIGYGFEFKRLESFKRMATGWPSTWMELEEKLAAAGFYYTGNSDMVRCFECHVGIFQWQPFASPMGAHQRLSKGCRFVRNIPCGNVPIDVDPSTSSACVPMEIDECESYSTIYMPYSGPDNEEFSTENAMKFKLEELTATRSKHPEYTSYDARLYTFETWPKAMSQTKEELAAAGFFYTGNGDQTLCYHCGEGLRDWEPEDDPWEEHAKRLDYCSYLHLMKGRDYINKFVGKTDAKSDIVKPSANIEQHQTSDR